MITLRVLAAVTVALGSIGSPAAAPMTDRVATEGTVLSLIVRADSARVDVVVGVRGDVTTKDFTLSGPDKIVVDISHASLGLARGQSYDHAARGGIVNVHYAQFKPGVVRVVVTLDAPHRYRVTREAAGIRISVEGSTSNLPAWAVGYVNAALAAVSPASAPSLARRDDASPRPSAPKYTTKATVAAKPAAPRSGAAETAEMWVNGRRLTNLQVQSQQRRITINFEDTPIVEVLKIFSDYSGHSILASKSVTGNVSASINDVPWDVALRAILNLNGFDAVQDEYGIITVNSFTSIHQQTAETARAEPLESRTIRFNYTSAATIAPMLTARLSRDCPTTTTTAAETTTPAAGGFANPNAPPAAVPVAQQPTAPATQTTVVTSGTCPTRGTATADTLTNSVSVTDIRANLDPLEAYAKTLDIRQPQVNIKAKIILVDRSTLEGFGIRYDLGSQTQFFNDLIPRVDSTGKASTTGQIALGGNAISAIANAGLRVPGAALQLAYSTALGAFDFTTFVEALQSTSLLDVQAEPNGTVLNNHTLELQAGTDVPIRTAEPGAGANSAGAVATVTVNVRTTGVILRVTPRVTNDNRVQMRIHVENSAVTFQGNDAVAFPKQSVDNEVMLVDGSTWVIGGLTQTTVTSTRTGIPVLIDLPIIGRLFGVTNRQEQKRDLLILITPHVVDPGQDVGSGH